MNKFEEHIDLIGEEFLAKYNVMDVIKTFMKEFNRIKPKNTNLYGLLDVQHDRQELIERWFGNGKI